MHSLFLIGSTTRGKRCARQSKQYIFFATFLHNSFSALLLAPFSFILRFRIPDRVLLTARILSIDRPFTFNSINNKNILITISSKKKYDKSSPEQKLNLWNNTKKNFNFDDIEDYFPEMEINKVIIISKLGKEGVIYLSFETKTFDINGTVIVKLSFLSALVISFTYRLFNLSLDIRVKLREIYGQAWLLQWKMASNFYIFPCVGRNK